MSRFVNMERLWYHWMRHFNVMKIMLKPISTWLVFRSNAKTMNLHLRQWKIYSSWNQQTKMPNFLRLRIFVAQGNYYPASVLATELLAQDPNGLKSFESNFDFSTQQKPDDALARIKELARLGKGWNQRINSFMHFFSVIKVIKLRQIKFLRICFRRDPTNVEVS